MAVEEEAAAKPLVKKELTQAEKDAIELEKVQALLEEGLSEVEPIPEPSAEEKKSMDEPTLSDEPMKVLSQPAPGVKVLSPELSNALSKIEEGKAAKKKADYAAA